MTKEKEDIKKNQEETEQVEDVSFEDREESQNGNQKKSKKAGSRKKAKKESKLEQEINDLQLKYAELNDKYLRLFSDFDNFRKRTIKERIELSKLASEELITELLPVVDDFERALGNIPEDDSTHQGILLIYNKLLKTLNLKGLEEIEAKGNDFDTDFHEAITKIPVEDESQKGKVVDVVQKGYTLSGKVIRYAKVVVGS